MKKTGLLLLVFAFLLNFCGCSSYKSPILSSLPDYKTKEFYTSGGIQYSTDYAKYTYDSVTVQDLKSTNYFTAVDADDIEEILLHLDNFEEWVEFEGGELKENFDFDKSIVSEGDFFYLETKAGQPIGEGTYDKFDCYSVYYFDIDAQTLYYFRNNI